MGDENAAPRGPGGDRWLTLPVREFIVKVAVASAAGAFALFLVFRALQSFGLRPTEVSMSATGMSVKMERHLAGGVTEYFMAVSPQIGWQDTDIEIRPGDEVTFWASGRVNLSIFRITEAVQRRRALEAALNCDTCAGDRARRFRDSLEANPMLTPEDMLDSAEIASMKPRQEWLGPEGDTTAMVDRSYPGRDRKRLAPTHPNGRLVGLILPKAIDPARGNVDSAFAIGRGRESKGPDRKTSQTGDLWLAVNDVWNGAPGETMSDAPFPADLFTLDNVGFFWVRITVKR